MKEKNAINFLLYSYFEVTLDNNEEELISGAIERAYRDASSRVLSITDETRSYSSAGQEEKLCKEAAAEFLQTKIRELSAAKEYDNNEYNDWFYKTCRHLETVIYEEAKDAKNDKAFRFGHAQKWVNMTMKYMCVMKSIFGIYGKVVFSWLTAELEQKLHIPVDSYVMEAAASNENISVKKTKREFPYGLGIELPNKQKEKGPYSTAKSWSKWDEDNYNVFRDELNGKFDGKNPLDWEGPAWIAIAKIRKERERK